MTDTTPAESQYSILPREGPYPAAIGSALITMVEPHEGHEQAYNRWYEDDHFYAGAMAMPWMFAGRRFVATRDEVPRFQELPSDSLQPRIVGVKSQINHLVVALREAVLRKSHALRDLRPLFIRPAESPLDRRPGPRLSRRRLSSSPAARSPTFGRSSSAMHF